MTISLNHYELTSFPRYLDGENTYLRYWQAQIPGTDLFAVTEEGFTLTERGSFLHLTRFFVCSTPAHEYGPARGVLVQDETSSYGMGHYYEACKELTEPHTWDDAPRQRMLQEAKDRAAQAQDA